jgi:hypothetical protein
MAERLATGSTAQLTPGSVKGFTDGNNSAAISMQSRGEPSTIRGIMLSHAVVMA